MTKPPRDPNTLSNYNSFRTIHTTTNFEIRFDQQRLVGKVIHQLKSLTDAQAKEIVLDSSFLDIDSVIVDGRPAKWQLLARCEPYGSALKIGLDNGVPLDQTIEVHDTPDVKATFDFNISSPLPVIASGVSLKRDESSGQVYRFEQRVPIPSYLFAIASGDIAQAPIGPRSKVAVSPDKLEECKWELEADTERFLQAIGKIAFPYVWGEYNVLILPPSFPYGGMENPVYTFATPSIISKDRQNIDVIAHEISHSWSGNLVTNCSWEHFWLNEGWTTYLERRIQAAIHGEPHRHFSAIIGWKQLIDAVERYGNEHEFTKLVIDLKGKDPDDAFSPVPYEKGFVFIFYLENLVGKEKFDKFIPHYFQKFSRKSLDSYEFKSCVMEYFASDTEAQALLKGVDWDSWFYQPGLPPKPTFDTSLVDVVYELVNRWKSLAELPFSPKTSDLDGLVAGQIVVFLEQVLLFDKPLSPEQSRLMGQIYNFSASQNIEVLNLYLQVGLKAGDDAVVEPTTKLLGEIGRMKFVRPLFRALEKFNRQIALKTFEKYSNFYHPICRGLLEKDLFGKKNA
ncbi:Leucyl aminopeptidase yscIV [Emydomyces testavorans]|uniref:Leucine aminopeptidase 2 n=1 Tax=Emydomyces testavorans TaxID=2070801 RepID=A0AAF0DP32_9EURO|nr:Leucyl aminopeptidase yscIV [Emydomyces testavorans]